MVGGPASTAPSMEQLSQDEVNAAYYPTAQLVHASGAVVCFANGGCPWKTHLYELERKHGLTEAAGSLVQFVLYPDSSGMWRVQAVTVEGTDFANRLSLAEPWRGLRDAALCEAAAIEGCKFCHASGFIGGNATYEGALAMALKTIELAK